MSEPDVFALRLMAAKYRLHERTLKKAWEHRDDAGYHARGADVDARCKQAVAELRASAPAAQSTAALSPQPNRRIRMSKHVGVAKPRPKKPTISNESPSHAGMFSGAFDGRKPRPEPAKKPRPLAKAIASVRKNNTVWRMSDVAQVADAAEALQVENERLRAEFDALKAGGA